MTITAKELYDATLRGEGLLAKHAKANPDMPVFVLIAQDNTADQLVDKWAAWASIQIEAADPGTLPDKVTEARVIAEAMRRWPIRKHPD